MNTTPTQLPNRHYGCRWFTHLKLLDCQRNTILTSTTTGHDLYTQMFTPHSMQMCAIFWIIIGPHQTLVCCLAKARFTVVVNLSILRPNCNRTWKSSSHNSVASTLNRLGVVTYLSDIPALTNGPTRFKLLSRNRVQWSWRNRYSPLRSHPNYRHAW